IPIGLGGIFVLLLYYLSVWFIAGRGPSKGTIVVLYEPPDNMSPATMRYIRKMGFDDRCFTSALLNIAAKGHVRISEKEGDYVITRSAGRLPLSKDEEKVLDHLLHKTQELRLETEGSSVASAVTALTEHLRTAYEKRFFIGNLRYFAAGLILSALVVVASGLGNLSDILDMAMFIAFSVYATMISPPFIVYLLELLKRWKSALAPGGARQLRVIKASVLTLTAVIPVSFVVKALSFMIDMATPYSIFFLAVAVYINYVFYQLLKAPTRAGRGIQDAIEGFREFLMMTEKDRMNLFNPPEKTPELFEKYLPYALALDVEQEWSEQFSGVLAGAALGEPGSSAALWKTQMTGLMDSLFAREKKGNSR
ncbi:MAG: DUF2207 domain-containing protein, partial [Nitrospirae bacterium]|nr:DUF2207 domain-containing protein [Nitrospirota bacterium]